MGVLTKDTGTMSKEPWPSACGIHISPISAASQLKKSCFKFGKHRKAFKPVFLQRYFTAQETATIYYHSCFNKNVEMEFQETYK